MLQAGQCLRDLLSKGNVSHEQQLKWICGFARGLQHMHDKSVIHADVSAAKVVISREHQAMWIDFGGSKIDNQEALANYDEYSYRAPEYPHPPVSQATDIFAFGCTIFEIETGAPPFYNETIYMSQDERACIINNAFHPWITFTSPPSS